MMTEKPILDYGESIKRGNVERERLDKLIAACGGIVPYMTGPRFTPREAIEAKEIKEHENVEPK